MFVLACNIGQSLTVGDLTFEVTTGPALRGADGTLYNLTEEEVALPLPGVFVRQVNPGLDGLIAVTFAAPSGIPIMRERPADVL